MVAVRAVTFMRVMAKVFGVIGLALSVRLLFDLMNVDLGVSTIFPVLNFFVVGLLILASVLALLG